MEDYIFTEGIRWMVLEGAHFGFGFVYFFLRLERPIVEEVEGDTSCLMVVAFASLFLRTMINSPTPVRRNVPKTVFNAPPVRRALLCIFTSSESRFSGRSHSGSVRLPQIFSVTTFSTECCKNSRLPEMK